MNDRFTTHGSTYDGAELKTRSSRPGAYDAFEIPSLLFGKQTRPVAAPVSAPSSVLNPTSTPRAPRASKGTPGTYRPQPGSVGDLVIAHLKKHGGTLTAKQIVELCGVERESVAGLMQRARSTGAVKHHIRDRKGYFYLPGTDIDAPAELVQPSTPTPLPVVDQAVAQQIQALRGMASNADELNHSLQQLQTQCLLLARAINDAIAALSPITTADLTQA